jgi:hypothetical protein
VHPTPAAHAPLELTVASTFGDRVAGSPRSRMAATNGCRDQPTFPPPPSPPLSNQCFLLGITKSRHYCRVSRMATHVAQVFWKEQSNG